MRKDMRTEPPNDTTHDQAECRRLAAALALAERDRQLLGYEIHDGLVQDLTAAMMLFEGAGREATFTTPENRESFAAGSRLLHESIAKARGLIQEAAGVAVGDDGFFAALGSLVQKVRADLGLPVQLESQLTEPRLDSSIQHLLLRIAQESLFNVWKHARASEVAVRLSKQDEQLELCIADNGVGFDPALVAAGHFGVAGIRARAEILGASLLFDTAPNHGTRVIVRLTLADGV